ncbi:SGNH/GDSL hydrolase family protein [Oscillatoria sp. FACHB-1406]|uniref:SGNH/GDSL hydrolase family protein n=1 Tax=Oscillatoria sp. FACHB-1406 TaxID=2692846 RepID=UPI0016829C61|nr:SGNH/GDSL hydrolase family protein [Oscillatoria sp. FACHB-1406]MBD2576103.1 SGNH/GDSL hydrolase family protein [Oscillatoria sp. FACHB-1406]
MRKRRKRFKLFLGGVVIGAIAIELFLRLAFGLGTPVLSQADPLTGYRFQPNQHVVRFGRTIAYNQYSQRSNAIATPKPAPTFRILMTGDSVLNGGTPIAQNETITALFQAELAKTKKSVEVLNASAGSWGIGNALGYLREFGLFDSNALILQIGTHDLVQPTSTSDRVGIDPNYPNHRPLLALQELFARYLLPRIFPAPPPKEIPTTATPETQFRQNMQSLRAIATLARQQNIPVSVLYTPNWTDILPQPSEPPFKAEFLKILTELNIRAYDSQAAWSKLPPATVKTYFRDSVHLTVLGNRALVKLLSSDER